MQRDKLSTKEESNMSLSDEKFPEGTEISRYEYNNAAEDHVRENPTHSVLVEFHGSIRAYATPLEVRCLTCGWWDHVAFAQLEFGPNPVDNRDDRDPTLKPSA